MSTRLNVLSLESLSDGTVIARVELPKGREYDIFKQAETLSISIADSTATPVTFPEPWPPPIKTEPYDFDSPLYARQRRRNRD